MIEAWVMRRPARLLLAGSVFVSGDVLTKLLIHISSFTPTICVGVLATSLAALVGTNKSASP